LAPASRAPSRPSPPPPPSSRRRVGGVLQRRRLAPPRLTPHHQRSAAPRPQILKEAIERRALSLAVQQRRYRLGSRAHTSPPTVQHQPPGAAKSARPWLSLTPVSRRPGRPKHDGTATSISSQTTGKVTCQEGFQPLAVAKGVCPMPIAAQRWMAGYWP